MESGIFQEKYMILYIANCPHSFTLSDPIKKGRKIFYFNLRNQWHDFGSERNQD